LSCEEQGVRRKAFFLRIVLLVMVLSAVSACGFQLRGQAKLPFRSVYVEAGEEIGADLKRAFIANDVVVKDEAKEAQAVLRILSETRQKHILAISGGGRVREYRLESNVSYRLDAPFGDNILPPAEISLTRDFSYDDTRILAKEEEEQLIWRDIQNDTVQQIMIRLSHAKL
jgi:LPS-assembly lipoprotein